MLIGIIKLPEVFKKNILSKKEYFFLSASGLTPEQESNLAVLPEGHFCFIFSNSLSVVLYSPVSNI